LDNKEPIAGIDESYGAFHIVTSNVEVSGLRGFSRRSARLPGWGS
jgi:hypothetical protein